MANRLENIVESIPTSEHERTLIVNCQLSCGKCVVEIRQQSYGGQRVGWFTQSSVQVPAASLKAVRAALGVAGAMPEMVAASKPSHQVADQTPESIISARTSRQAIPLRVWHAESA